MFCSMCQHGIKREDTCAICGNCKHTKCDHPLLDMNRELYGEERKAQKDFLRIAYADYNPRHHTVFLRRWQAEEDKRKLDAYLKARGL